MNFYTFNRGLHRRLHSYYTFKSRRILYRNKINRMIKEGGCDTLNKKKKKEIKTFFKGFGLVNVSTKWHDYYSSITGIFDIKYIPEDLFYNVIEPTQESHK